MLFCCLFLLITYGIVGDYLKVDFVNEDQFTIYCIYEERIDDEYTIKNFFRFLSKRLITGYDYEFSGYYDVNIYKNGNAIILEFEREDDFGRADFNITMLLNSTVLYEFENDDLVNCNKIYYKYKYYCDINHVVDRIDLFEFGNLIYGIKAEEVLNRGLEVV